MTGRKLISFRWIRSAAAVVSVCALITVSATAADDQKQSKKESKRSETHIIEKMEQDWIDALLKSDSARLENMLADDFLGISATGRLSDKPQYIRLFTDHANEFKSIDVIDTKVRLQPSSAIVVSQVRVVGQLEGRPINGVFRYTKVYGRSAGGVWRVLNFEATRVSGSRGEAPEMHRGMPLNFAPDHSPVN